MTQMTPPEIVSELDKHIVGQARAKRVITSYSIHYTKLYEEDTAESTPRPPSSVA